MVTVEFVPKLNAIGWCFSRACLNRFKALSPELEGPASCCIGCWRSSENVVLEAYYCVFAVTFAPDCTECV